MTTKETQPYPTPELQKGGSFYAKIPLFEGYEKVIGDVESDEELQARLNAYARRITNALGLNVDRLTIDEMGLSDVSVLPGQCACISITGDSWKGRVRLPEFSTHNVDTPEQYIALTSIVFYYLNKLQGLAKDKPA